MSKRNCYVTDVGNAIEALATALDPERKPPFKGDILDLLEWAEKDVLEMRKKNTTLLRNLRTARWERSEEELLAEIEKLRLTDKDVKDIVEICDDVFRQEKLK